LKLNAECQVESTARYANFQSISVSGLGDPFGIEEAAAQAFVFFFAGFETSSTTITFTLYELAKHPEIQTKLQEEMDGMLKKDNGEVKYNSLLGLEYLDNVIAGEEHKQSYFEQQPNKITNNLLLIFRNSSKVPPSTGTVPGMYKSLQDSRYRYHNR